MTYKLDYGVAIPKVVQRLRAEHRDFEQKFSQIYQVSESGDLEEAIALLKGIRTKVLRHAVEEEARLMRVIMWELKDKSDESVGILRKHREIVDFFKHRLDRLSELPSQVARREIRIFVDDLKKHHAEEEKIVFPLALRAESIYRKRTAKL